MVKIYKNLKHVERDFKTIKIDDLDVRAVGRCEEGAYPAEGLYRGEPRLPFAADPASDLMLAGIGYPDLRYRM